MRPTYPDQAWSFTRLRADWLLEEDVDRGARTSRRRARRTRAVRVRTTPTVRTRSWPDR